MWARITKIGPLYITDERSDYAAVLINSLAGPQKEKHRLLMYPAIAFSVSKKVTKKDRNILSHKN